MTKLANFKLHFAICNLQLPVACAFRLLATAANRRRRHAAEQPNVLFVFTDDQRADTIAALGNSHIRTPHLDRLVADGTVMRRAYCMGALQGAVCVPSRAMLLTGRTLFRINPIWQGQTTWPEQFAAAGYTTFITGKWHNQASSVVRALSTMAQAIFLGGMGEPYSLPVQDLGPTARLVNKRLSKKHSVELFTDCAVEFIEHQPKDKPFLAYVAFNCRTTRASRRGVPRALQCRQAAVAAQLSAPSTRSTMGS